MKSNKELVYEFIRKCANITDEGLTKGVSTQYVSKELGMQRTNISTLLNALVNEKRVEKMSGRPVLYRIANMPTKSAIETSCFKTLTGHDKSLKNAVQLAKAAILYPERSLHTLILGEGGTGKSLFAQLMYEFALENEVIHKDAPFIKFNCRNYNDDEGQMIKQLFGTNFSEHCALKEAQGGILFIDHVDLLPARFRSTLFTLLEANHQEVFNVNIICAADDFGKNTNMALKAAYTTKFSAKIELPSLNERTMGERLELVSRFFTKEALRVKRVIKINSDLLRCLLLYVCDYNVKQLKVDIKIACANAYVRELNTNTDTLYVYINDFQPSVRKGFLFYKEHREEIEQLIPRNYSYLFSGKDMEKVAEADILSDQETVYDIIERKAAELKERGIMAFDIQTIISAEIESDLTHITKTLGSKNINKESLAKIVDNRIISVVERFLDVASQRFQRVYPSATFYGLCLHLSSTLERSNKTQHLSNDKVMDIVEKHKAEYAYCMEFSLEVEKEFDIHLPVNEVVFITMFICDNSLKKQAVKKPVILIAMYGKGTAASIAEVVNSLVKCDNTFAYDLLLEKNMKVAYEELKEYICEIDEGKGILMLYDMGSLKSMAETIVQETNINIQMIQIPATLIALDSARKARSEMSLDQIYNSVIESYQKTFSFMEASYHRQNNKTVIITLCMSGKGGAIQIKNYLEKNMDTESIDIIPYAISDREYLLNEVNTLKKERDILCVIGTYNPNLFQIPFISIKKLFETPVEKLSMLLALEEMELDTAIDYDGIYVFLSEEMADLDIQKLKKYLPKSIVQIKKSILGLTQDQELGLFMHVACSVQRIKEDNFGAHHPHRDNIIKRNKRLYNNLKDIFKPLENAFEIELNDDEIANIISIIKKA